ncbi:hypothetical protein DL98DRAFT_620167 [Cadophora sp. DSE1049]|nr:hypothetical protein DL98DRAFT_620167 [Cadophora sp. DSE1049]
MISHFETIYYSKRLPKSHIISTVSSLEIAPPSSAKSEFALRSVPLEAIARINMETQGEGSMSPKLLPTLISNQTNAIANSRSIFDRSAQNIVSSSSTFVDIEGLSTSVTFIENHRPSALNQDLDNPNFTAPADANMMMQFSLDAAPINAELNSSVSTNRASLSKIPFELRDKIFEHCVDIVDGKTPNLMIALRCNKELYPQALDLHFKINYFTLNGITKDFVKNVSPKAIANIRNLCIDNRDGSLAALCRNLPRPLWSGARNLRTIVVLSDGPQGFLDCLWAQFCVQRHKGITKVYYDRGLQDGLLQQSKPVEYLSKGLGLPHTAIKGGVAGESFDGYIWDTKSLKPLVWTEEGLSAADYLR